jgi:gamma-butyrobetaine dioxygenase
MRASAIEILDAGRAARITWTDGRSARFHAIWLRDCALDAGTRSIGNGQRLISVLDIPPSTTIALASIATDGDLHITFAPEGHEAVFPALWLRERIYDKPATNGRGWVSDEVVLWDGALQGQVPTGSYTQLRTDRRALRNWLAGVRRYGFATMTEVPRDSGGLCEAVKLFGYVRETNYGRWFDVRAEINPINLAYTNLGLQAHTDNPYREPVPTLQILSCLENSVDGGDSIVVDGFTVADQLRRDHPHAFDLLSRFPARFEYAGSSDVRLRAKRPFIELGADGEMIAIRFNNRSTAPLLDVPYGDMPDFYGAYRRFAEILGDPRLEVTFKLRPGELFIVDNTRVMHARRPFSGSGQRWLQGCYADKDGLLSTLAAIEAETFKEVAE